MAGFAIRIDLREIDGLAEVWEQLPESTLQITVRTLNDVARRTRTLIVRQLQATKNLTTQKNLRRAIFLNRATKFNPVATIIFTGRRIPLIDFGGRWLTGAARQRFNKMTNEQRRSVRGATYRIDLDGEQKEARRAFIAKFKSGHRGIFRRQPKAKGSKIIDLTNLVGRKLGAELRGPSLPQVVEDAGPEALIEAEKLAISILQERLLFHVSDAVAKKVTGKGIGRGAA